MLFHFRTELAFLSGSLGTFDATFETSIFSKRKKSFLAAPILETRNPGYRWRLANGCVLSFLTRRLTRNTG